MADTRAARASRRASGRATTEPTARNPRGHPRTSRATDEPRVKHPDDHVDDHGDDHVNDDVDEDYDPATASARTRNPRTRRSPNPLRRVPLPLLPPRSSWQRSSCVTAPRRTPRTTGRAACSTSSASRRPHAPRQHPHARWPTTTPPGRELPLTEHHRLHLHLRLRRVPR